MLGIADCLAMPLWELWAALYASVLPGWLEGQPGVTAVTKQKPGIMLQQKTHPYLSFPFLWRKRIPPRNRRPKSSPSTVPVVILLNAWLPTCSLKALPVATSILPLEMPSASPGKRQEEIGVRTGQGNASQHQCTHRADGACSWVWHCLSY